MNIDIVHRELDEVAMNLTEEIGYYVVSPIFHSLSGTSPGRATGKDIAKLWNELLAWAKADAFDMVIGKGWGGVIAARASVEQPMSLDRLVLIAPGGLRTDYGDQYNLTIPVKTLLLYNIDDSGISHD